MAIQCTSMGVHSHRSQGHPRPARAHEPLELLAMGSCTISSLKHNLTCPSVAAERRLTYMPSNGHATSTEYCANSDG